MDVENSVRKLENDMRKMENTLIVTRNLAMENDHGINSLEMQSINYDVYLAKLRSDIDYFHMSNSKAYVIFDILESKAKAYLQEMNDEKLKEQQKKNKYLREMIEKVEFHKPWTIVWWNDGSKTKVKQQKGDKWNKEVGLMAAMSKKLYEGSNIFNDEINKWCNK